MADNVTIDNGTETDFIAATDDIGGVQYQKVKLVDGTADSATAIPGDGTYGLAVDIKRATDFATKITDGTDVADVLDLTNSNPLTVAIVDGSGNQVTSFGGAGGTSSTDDADFTPVSTSGTPVMGVYEPTPTSVTGDDMGIVGITETRALKISVAESALDVDHGSVDGGQPVKVGGRALSALPTAVDTGDRANAIADLFGRLLTGHISPEMQITKNVSYTTAQTGTSIWNPTEGKRIAVTHVQLGTYGTTAGRLILWFGAAADTTFSQDTDQVVFAGSFAPSATSKPGVVQDFSTPAYCQTANHELRITTATDLSVDVTVYGYEW